MGLFLFYKKEVRKIALTRQQKAFADEYVKTLKVKDSYLKAYKSCKSVDSAYSAGSRLLKNKEVKAYIEERLKILDEEMIADQREVLRRLSRQARREEKDHEIVLVEKPFYNDEGKCIGIGKVAQVVELPTQNKDAIKALELLGRYHDLFNAARLEVDLEPIIISGADDLED